MFKAERLADTPDIADKLGASLNKKCDKINKDAGSRNGHKAD